MGGFRGLGCVFHRRRKRNVSSRYWAMKSKKPLVASATPTAPVPDNKTKVDNDIEETSVQATKQLSSRVVFMSIRALFSGVGSLLQKCRKTINQTCCGFLNVFLFWRGYAERVESLHQKVEVLQMEMALLHSTLKLSREAKSAGSPCGDQQSTPLPLSLAAPPPPPPPPPPLPPQILVTLAAPKGSLIPKKTAQTSSLKETQSVAVTLRDLQAVRLKKVTVGQKTQMSPERRSPLVTLADLQKVRLRRSNSDLPLKFKSKLGRTPTKNPMSLRVPLRKVNLIRSPGGTPMYNKENDVMDLSLDPKMTKGLGNKHLRALTKGLSPIKPF
ncbi:uncharacterized protein prr11 [Siphateles boraxobius]|uniref:uncharacterized protein prr11 n=1 Tax=Siphateles boraxobius TaxID=180520 RepID=UPI004062E41B